jgi:HlyD family secretion protein
MKNSDKHAFAKIFPGIAFIAFLPLAIVSCNKAGSGEYSVMRGPFRQSVVEKGELQALHSSYVSMPRVNYIYGSTYKVIRLAEHGKTVKKGETVVVLDPASVQKYIIDRRESLETEIANSTRLKAQIDNNMQDLKAQLQNEESAYDMKKIQKDRSAFESEGIKKVIALEFRQEEIKLEKIRRNLKIKPGNDSLDYHIQQIKINQKENELTAAMEALEKFTINSPLDGIFVVERNSRTGKTIKLGDEVYLGYPLAQIPDIRTMKVSGYVLENDYSKVKPGLDVIVRLDALPSVPFHGKLIGMSKVCTSQDGKKVFSTEVNITESDLRLKPGMTVSCEYITYENNDELFVPSTCILEENKHYYLFVRRKGKITKTEVRTGYSNNMYTSVSGDIKPGQSLVLPSQILTR